LTPTRTIISVAAQGVNLYDLIHYPHVGRRQPGQFEGPPVLFILLNFVLFGWLFTHYVWPFITGEVTRRHHETDDLLKAADRMERDARARYESALDRSARLEFERRHIQKTIEGESELDLATIEEDVTEYELARLRETTAQIQLKREAVDQGLREEMILAVTERAHARLEDMITPEERLRLIHDALDESRRKEAHHG